MSPARSLARVAVQSLLSRRLACAFVVLAVAVSTVLYLSVERLRAGAWESFTSTISGTDLIVGAPSGGVQLMLSTVFRIGTPNGAISAEATERVAAMPDVAWTVPIALGDSHRGYRVVGTTGAYFDRVQYGRGRSLTFDSGRRFEDLFDVVLGAEVARALGYDLGQRVIVAHGLGSAGLVEHDDLPFTVSGILAPTGTPVDRAVYVSLDAITAIHVDWALGARARQTTPAAVLRSMDLSPTSVTALLVGLDSRLAVFRTARAINDMPGEPLQAVLPGVALQELWSVVGAAERALALVSAAVVLTAIVGLVATLLATLEQRRREMAILRTLGARPTVIGALLMAESGLLALTGVLLGALVVLVAEPFVSAWLVSRYGLDLAGGIAARDAVVLGAIVAAALLAALIPAWRASRMSAGEGLGG